MAYEMHADTGEADVHHIHRCLQPPKTFKTAKQTVSIVQTSRFGEALFIDGAIQSTRTDEALYHVPLVHGASAFLENPPRNVLIIGGGEGCVARELLKYNTIESITQVDWDVELVDYFRRGPGRSWNGGVYDDPRVRVIHDDIFTEANAIYTQSYDLILVDLCDPDGESIGMLKALIVRLFGLLVDGGVFLMNAGAVMPKVVASDDSIYAAELLNYAGSLGSARDYKAFSYKIYVPSYMAPWCLVGLARGNTIGDWVGGHDVDVSAWMTYDRSYDPVFQSVNAEFMRYRGSVAPSASASELMSAGEWGC